MLNSNSDAMSQYYSLYKKSHMLIVLVNGTDYGIYCLYLNIGSCVAKDLLRIIMSKVDCYGWLLVFRVHNGPANLPSPFYSFSFLNSLEYVLKSSHRAGFGLSFLSPFS